MRKPSTFMATALGAVLLACSAVSSNTALADTNPSDRAAAQGLFDQAKGLMSQGKYADACPKLEESQRLDPGLGTLFNLADCYEKAGRTASAWTLFLDVEARTRSSNQSDRERIARQRASALAPKVPKLVIVAPPNAPEGLEIKRDGSALGKAQWTTPVPVDPGMHAITASAPGKQPWQSSIEVPATGATVTLTVPPLQDASTSSAAISTAPPATTSVTPSTTSPTSGTSSESGSLFSASTEGTSKLGTQRTLALAAGGVGVVGVIVGTVFGLKSKSNHDGASSHCNGNLCDADGLSLRQDAIHAGNLSTLGFVIGALGIGGGAALWFTAPPASSASTTSAWHVAPNFGKGLASLSLKGNWLL